MLAVSGLLVQQGVKLSVVAEVKSKLVNNGCVQSHIVASNTDANSAETLLASWNGMLNILLRSRAANTREQDARDAEQLFQCFAIPASQQTVESIAQELLVTDEQLIISYTIPKSEEELPLEIPPPKPAILITQPHMPLQTVQGAPVTIELDAQITKESTPPYDYAWTSDLSPNPIPQFGATFTISSVPVVASAGGEPQTLTTAHLKVIDMFGQDAETQAPAKYLPATKQKQHQSGEFHAPILSASGVIGSVPKWLLIALAGLVVLAASGITLALIYKGGGRTPSRPGTITEFSLPTGGYPYGITVGRDGNLWFNEENGNKIGRITLAGKITEFPIQSGAVLEAITVGRDGNLWFTVSHTFSPFIGRITLAGKVTEFPLPGGFHFDDLYGITAGPDDNLWFTEYFGNKIGRITLAGKITEFPIHIACGSSLDCGLFGITAGPDGNLLFTEDGAGKIGRITPGGATTGFSAPTDLASDAAGALTAGLPGTFFPLIQSGGPFLRRTLV